MISQPIGSVPRAATWWRRAILGAVALVVLLGAAILIERWMEDRDAARLTASESFAKVEGARVRYRLLGAGQPGASVVLLSGLLGTVEQWEQVQAAVAARHAVLAYDRGGYGFSRGSHAHDAGAQADELAGLLAALGIEGQVVLVGFSSSASIARLFAARHPERVAGLVFLDPYLPEFEERIAGRPGQFRNYARTFLLEGAMTLFGLRRLSGLKATRGRATGRSDAESRVEAVLKSYQHWSAVVQEWLATGETARQVLAISGAELPPLISFSSAQPDQALRATEEVARGLVSHSRRGEAQRLPLADHGRLLDDPAVCEVVTTAIERLANPAAVPHLR